jgi:hypothetical protein
MKVPRRVGILYTAKPPSRYKRIKEACAGNEIKNCDVTVTLEIAAGKKTGRKIGKRRARAPCLSAKWRNGERPKGLRDFIARRMVFSGKVRVQGF